MSSKMADLRHPGEAHESERGQARQVREDFRLLQAAATVYRADVVDRDRAGLAEAGHGARGFALDSPLEEGGFELALALGCIAGDGNAGAGAGARIGFVGQNSRRERDSLIRAEISLIADLNSLQDYKKFPVPVRRELARKPLVKALFWCD